MSGDSAGPASSAGAAAAQQEEDEDFDFLDAVLNFDSSTVSEGLALGAVDGSRQGFEEGKKLGIVKGKELGEEIGFYSGVVHTWLGLAEAHASKFNSKTVGKLQRLKAAIASYPLGRSLDVEMVEKMELIRAKFKSILSSLELQVFFAGKQGFAGSAASSGSKDLSF